MGAGIAQVAAQAGHPVLLFDAVDGAVARALARIESDLGRLVEKGRLRAEARDAVVARIRPCAEVAELAPAGLVVEAIVEALDAKTALLREVERITGEATIFASNTSSLSITAIAAAARRPERVVGMHFFNPAPAMALVEVVSGLATSPDVAATVFATAASWGKSPVHARSTPGFIVNRVARPFYGEALRLLEEGAADCATLDAILRDAGGFRMGPFELMDLIGHDVNFAVTSSVHAAFHGDPRYRPSIVQQELVRAGRLGRKSGRGFYAYGGGAQPPAPATTPARPAPSRVVIEGDLGPAAALEALAREARMEVSRAPGEGRIAAGPARLALTDGRLATERAAGATDLVLFDLALDYRAARRVAIAGGAGTTPAAVDAAAGFFQALGKQVSILPDLPGLAVMRTVAMLANEGADAVHLGVCDAAAVDGAMVKGVNYPLGPLAWADRVGPRWILAVMDGLARAYGEDRYRASLLLRRIAAAGGRFQAP
jgi:3-hydroxybutyryl-CoA dehydrogenase